MIYKAFKDLTSRITSDKSLRYKALNIAQHLKYGVYQPALASMVYKSFAKYFETKNFK